ncbi:hypothetical protein GGX14DRAFT_541436 [Mycena pura]|uniref:F-box domain-containing protein n=1 Tax=Mycena pura TaxID=153505 RepID=A0AAD6VSM2_9AGAR|nr:hypothetical protein GGX14DRAFT_541436 [Mycena pura]
MRMHDSDSTAPADGFTKLTDDSWTVMSTFLRTGDVVEIERRANNGAPWSGDAYLVGTRKAATACCCCSVHCTCVSAFGESPPATNRIRAEGIERLRLEQLGRLDSENSPSSMAVCNDSSSEGDTAPPESSATLRERLSEIESEMAPIQARLAHLATARKMIVDALESIVFPVLTIPPEITAEVFVHYVDWANGGDPRTRRGGPLVLASVCKSWRSIALNFPKIWSEIHISNSIEGLPGVEKWLRCWLQRAGDHALALDMTSSHTPQSIFPLLAPYSMQWETFMCSVEVPYPMDEIKGRLPLLRTLTIESNIPKALITAFSNAPLLREARLVFVSIALPWVQLSTLSLVGWKRDCLQILQQTLNLEVLTISHFDVSWHTHPATSVHCRLDRLRSLTFEYIPYASAGIDFLDFLTLPALTHLEVAKHNGSLRRPASHVHLLNFIERSRCLLRSLSFGLIDEITHDNAVEIIRCIPSVTELSMRITTRADARRLLERIADWLPNLRKLCIKTWDHPDKVEIVGHGGCGSTEGRWAADRWLQEIQFVAQQN